MNFQRLERIIGNLKLKLEEVKIVKHNRPLV